MLIDNLKEHDNLPDDCKYKLTISDVHGDWQHKLLLIYMFMLMYNTHNDHFTRSWLLTTQHNIIPNIHSDIYITKNNDHFRCYEFWLKHKKTDNVKRSWLLTRYISFQMFMLIENIITFDVDDIYTDIDSCALEMSHYISQHDNWKKPILPGEDGCSDMDFDPDRFDFVFARWICPSIINGKMIF